MLLLFQFACPGHTHARAVCLYVFFLHYRCSFRLLPSVNLSSRRCNQILFFRCYDLVLTLKSYVLSRKENGREVFAKLYKRQTVKLWKLYPNYFCQCVQGSDGPCVHAFTGCSHLQLDYEPHWETAVCASCTETQRQWRGGGDYRSQVSFSQFAWVVHRQNANTRRLCSFCRQKERNWTLLSLCLILIM